MSVMKKKLWRHQKKGSNFLELLQDSRSEEETAINYDSCNLEAVQEEESDDDDNLSEDPSDDDEETESEDDDNYKGFAFAQENLLCSIRDKPGIQIYWIVNP